MSGEFTVFSNLLRNVQLTAGEIRDASGKHDRVRRCLNRHFYGLDSGVANSFLVGSYGKSTEITPPSDVDILFELPYSVWARYQSRVGNVQSQLLQEVRSVLLRTFATTAIQGDGQIVSVPFSTYAIEVLPAFGAQQGTYLHADANGGGKWRTTHPKQEMSELTRSNTATGGKTVHLVKLIKAWKVTCAVKIKSFVVELAAVKFLAQWPYNTHNGSVTGFIMYDWMMRDFFTWLSAQTNQWWITPGVMDFVHTGDAWAAQARFAAIASARACEHHAANRPDLALQEWRNVFGAYV